MAAMIASALLMNPELSEKDGLSLVKKEPPLQASGLERGQRFRLVWG
jgi:hypothetical protein